MNILLINAYSTENRGDAGIVVSMIYKIRESYPDAKISVMSSYANRNMEFYSQYGVDSIKNVWVLNPKDSTLLKYIKGIKSISQTIFKTNQKDLKHYLEADLIVSVGGGYLYSSNRGPAGIGLMNSLYHIWLATKLDKKIVCFPQSVGPLKYKLDQFIAKKILGKVNAFFSREETTTKLLKKMNVKNIHEVSDIAFLLPGKVSGFNVDSKEYNVGITVMDWRFSHTGASEVDLNEYINKIVWALSEAKKKIPNLKVYIFPQVTVGENDSDYTQSKILYNSLPFNQKELVLLSDIANNPEELVDVYSKMSVFIGSRMHSTIFSLTGGVPTIALSYQPKTRGTFKRLGLEKYVYDIKNFKKEDLLNELFDIKSSQENYSLETVDFAKEEINQEIDKVFKFIV